MAPIIREIQKDPDTFDLTVKSTGQHREMLAQALSIFSITPDIDLDIMAADQTLAYVTSEVLTAMQSYLQNNETDVVVVQGDTTTTMAAALASFYSGVRVAHVEAGLRTGNNGDPFPEEMNRRVTSLVGHYHFAPTDLSAQNLLREGLDPARVHVTGNPVIDALMYVLEHTEAPPTPIAEDRPYILMTCHRRESFGAPIREIFGAIRAFAQAHPEFSIWYPVHPNPNAKEPAHEILGDVENVVLSEPLDYVGFVHAMKGAYLVVSDSGGVQEEAPSLGKPVLVLRDLTERPEAAEAGTCRLVGPHRDRIIESLERLLSDKAEYQRMAGISNPFGDGTAAKRIVSLIRDDYA